jgi:diguanylate cyclase (GGDEF)-like protein
VANWVYGFSRVVERLGWRSAWFFHAGAASLVGLGVALVLVLWDGTSWPTALLAGLVVMVPAAGAGAVALALAHALARTTSLEDPLGDDDDELEGVNTRRQFLRQADREWSRCRRYSDDGALLLIDTDHLRRINQTLGQRNGDALLLEMTRCVHATLRQSDLLGRFGGAELAVFLPHTDPLGAVDAAERIRQKIASTPFMCGSAQVMLTVSVGVGHVHAAQSALDGLIHDAEVALNMAKEAGRNCVRAAPILPRQDDSAPSAVTPR